ncbi:MAG: HAD-IA family hydrolase [Burkholderiaceae bacterium]
MALSVLIFDIDGTVAETEERHRAAFNAAFAEAGLPDRWDPETYRKLLTVPGGHERLSAWFHGGLARPQGPAHEVDSEMIARLHARKTRHYAQMDDELTSRLRPGIVRLLDEAEGGGLVVAIASTTTQANLDVLLEPALGPDWRERFAAIVAGNMVVRKKPAPDVYLECLRRLGVPGSEAIAFEDSPPGVAAASAAGIATIATPSLYTRAEDLGDANLVLPNLGDPDHPLDAPPTGMPNRWVDVAGLRAWHQLLPPREASRGPNRSRLQTSPGEIR